MPVSGKQIGIFSIYMCTHTSLTFYPPTPLRKDKVVVRKNFFNILQMLGRERERARQIEIETGKSFKNRRFKKR